MQRFFWAYWYSDRDDSLVNQTSLVACFLVLWTLLVLLFVAYYYEGSVYVTGSIWIFCALAAYLLLAMGMLIGDRIQVGYMEEGDSSFYFSIYQQGLLLLTMGLNICITTTAIVDTTRHSP